MSGLDSIKPSRVSLEVNLSQDFSDSDIESRVRRKLVERGTAKVKMPNQEEIANIVKNVKSCDVSSWYKDTTSPPSDDTLSDFAIFTVLSKRNDK